jgi:hypothetical protein
MVLVPINVRYRLQKYYSQPGIKQDALLPELLSVPP